MQSLIVHKNIYSLQVKLHQYRYFSYPNMYIEKDIQKKAPRRGLLYFFGFSASPLLGLVAREHHIDLKMSEFSHTGLVRCHQNTVHDLHFYKNGA